MQNTSQIRRGLSVVGPAGSSLLTRPTLTRLAATLGSLVSLLSSGCAVPVDEAGADEVSRAEQPIENGELRPSSLNGGTVRIKIHGPTGTNACSGQVVARDTILTAAHCLYDVGVYSGGWSKKKAVKVTVTHQDPDGSWTSLSAPNESVSAFVREEYVTRASKKDVTGRQTDLSRFGWDMAVLRRSIPYGNLVSSDVSALVTASAGQVKALYIYGHGFFKDEICDRGLCNTAWDEQLRRGYFDALTWDRSSSSQYYRTVRSDTLSADAHSCSGDSGGPWKTIGYSNSTPTSGVQYGVHVSGSGTGTCAEVNARGAIVGYLDHWVRDVILDGSYASCQDTAHQVFTGSAWEWIDTRICW